MSKPLLTLIAATLFAAPALQAQLAATPQPSQAQSPPCIADNKTNPSTQDKKLGSTIVDKWKKKLNDEAAKLGKQTGVPMPTTDDLGQLGSAKPIPCPPKVAAPAPATAPQAAAAQPATVKLPPDTFVTLRCNPMTPSPQGGGRQTTLTLPDPKDFAVPKPNDFLADSVVPDTAAKTPCYLIKVDPKTGKSFVQQ
jgi:hypothetical protein